MPVHDARGQRKAQAIFTIEVMLEPLASAVCTPAQAQRLHAALQSMDASMLDYKNLSTARTPLLCWLSRVAREEHEADL